MNFRSPVLITTVTSAVSVAAGAALGYAYAKELLVEQLEKEFAERLDREIEDTKEYYNRLHKTEEYSDPEKLAEKYDGKPEDGPTVLDDKYDNISENEAREALKRYKAEHEVSDEEVTVEPKSIFDGEVPEFDLEVEKSMRTDRYPYIITQEEFFENEPENEQTQVTYFEGDDVLVDSKEVPLKDIDEYIGEGVLSRFGAGSNDRNIVYVRNPRLGVDFEVIHSEGSYSQEVLGIGLQHSDTRPRKFRNRDD